MPGFYFVKVLILGINIKMNKEIERKNKILAAILVVITLISVLGAIIWFNMYAPLILN